MTWWCIFWYALPPILTYHGNLLIVHLIIIMIYDIDCTDFLWFSMIFYDIDRQAQSINEWQAQHLKNLRQVTWQAQYINEWQAQYLGAATYFGHMFHQNVLQKDAPNIHACASPDGMGYNNTNRFVCLAFARSPKKTQGFGAVSPSQGVNSRAPFFLIPSCDQKTPIHWICPTVY